MPANAVHSAEFAATKPEVTEGKNAKAATDAT